MSELKADQVTRLLNALARGETACEQKLVDMLYDELRELAERELARVPAERTLQATALAHEVYLRLLGEGRRNFEDRRHFYFAAARAVHDILVERARRRASLRRGGAWRPVDLEHLDVAVDAAPEDLLALEEALQRLEKDDPRKRRIVELRFFGGLTAEQTAMALDMPLRSLEREWHYIRARLHRELSDGRAAEATRAPEA